MRRGELFLNLVFVFGGLPIAIALVIGITLPFLANAPLQYILIMFLCWLVGLGLFLKAKLSIIKQGRFLSFGSAGMSQLNRFCYRAGFVVMTIALFLSLILYLFFRVRN